MAHLQVEALWGYSGGKITVLQNGDLCYGVGNAVLFWNTATGKRRYLWNTSTGMPLTLVVFSNKQTMFVVGEKKDNPHLYVHSYPDMRETQVLQNITAMEYSDAAFSRDGSHLAVLGSIPDFNFAVHTVNPTTKTVQLLCRGSAAAHQGKAVSFSPSNKEELTTTGNGHITFWRIEKNQGQAELTPLEGRVSSHQTRVVCHCYVPGSEVVAGTSTGDLYRFDPSTGYGDAWWESPGGSCAAVVSLVVTRHHIVATSMDGIIRFFNHDSRAIDRSITLATADACYTTISPEWTTFFVGGRDGVIFAVRIPEYNSVTLTSDAFRDMSCKEWAIADFSGGGLMGVAHCAEDAVATVGDDNMLRIWKYRESILYAKVEVGQRPLCVASGCNNTAHLLAVGSATSHVRFVDVSVLQGPTIVGQERLAESGEVVRVVFDPTGKLVVAVVNTGNTGTLFFLEPQAEIVVKGRFPVESTVKDVAWLPNDPFVVLFACVNGDVKQMRAPLQVVEDPDDLKENIMNSWKLDLPAERIALVQELDEMYLMSVQSRDKGVKMYTLDKSQKASETGKHTVVKAHSQWKQHDKLGVGLIVGKGGVLYSASQDGKVEIRDTSSRSGEKAKASVNCHSPFDAGCTDISLSPDTQWLLTTGADGVLAIWSVHRSVHLDQVPFRIMDQAELVEVPDDENTYIVKRELEHQRKLDLKYKAHREQMYNQIADLREQLKEYREENSRASPEEQLDVSEFMIKSQREEILEEGRQRMLQVEDEIKWKNLANEYIADKIKKECWECMEEHLLVLHGMNPKTDIQVPNYNILKVGHHQKTLLRKIRFLRKVEQLEWQRRTDFNFDEDFIEKPSEEEGEEEGGVTSPASPGLRSPTSDDAPPEEEQEETGEEEPALLTIDQIAELPVDEFLYNRYFVYTRVRIIIQMTLLQQQVEVKRRAFNLLVKEQLERKKVDISKILEKNVRIKQICRELDIPEKLFVPDPVPTEDPMRILTIDESELQVEKYLNEEDRKKKEEEEEERDRLRREQDDEANERALKIMMDNRLERDERVVVEIKKPPFADENHKDYKPQDDWGDEEIKAWRDYEKRLAKRQEEEEKIRKGLQTELKDLQKDVDKVVSDYDAALSDLFTKKLATDSEINQLDLQIIKLAQATVQQEEMENHALKLAKIVDQAKAEAAKSSQLVQDSHRELQLKRERYDELLAHEKRRYGEKEIRLQPPFSETEEHCEVLLKLLKKSTKPKKDKARKDDKKGKKDDTYNPDPFAFVDEEEEEKRRKGQQQPEVETKLEKPDGLREDLWREFLEFRRERMEVEREQKLVFDELQEMSRNHEKLVRESKALQQNLDQKIKIHQNFEMQMIRENYNLDILHTFKQGQIEVEQEAVVTDYADAILIHKSDIEKLNSQIVDHGRAKVDKMKEIMLFQKGIRFIEWENKMLEHEVGHHEMDLRHLHTLRVTKAMQEFIKGGGENHHELERASLHRKIEHVRNTMQSKIDEKKAQMQKIKRIIKDKEVENGALAEQVKEAQQLVGEREEIHHLQSTGLDHQRNLKLMKDMRVTRKLEDVAKAQQEEMQLLKKEIDRLRERTFPSFAVVSKRVVGNPDEVS